MSGSIIVVYKIQKFLLAFSGDGINRAIQLIGNGKAFIKISEVVIDLRLH
jgi:hypothetical protein